MDKYKTLLEEERKALKSFRHLRANSLSSSQDLINANRKWQSALVSRIGYELAVKIDEHLINEIASKQEKT